MFPPYRERNSHIPSCAVALAPEPFQPAPFQKTKSYHELGTIQLLVQAWKTSFKAKST